ncbi:hypothetical protein DEU56DRAFT_840864 [Suillus clintonianus]|uniref:uncharacterized protein n=1 Tax=Suillus clintonianus TaxID=1904413 RepID=UPI001B884A02|nr:uncharacterized protein DEU56DRAFT_840864 [Suillus clintonianus]KAG2115526.1 hypothetical protein DEU56DRAFT_840864 [Suillus clintonianus]
MVEHCNPSAVAVYCAASLGKQDAFRSAALSLGRALAEAKRPLVYGGGNCGIMGVVSGAVMDEGGKVIGVIPYAIHAAGGEIKEANTVTRSQSNAEVLDEKKRGQIETIIVDSMHERKVEMAKRVGAFVGLPGGYGTFEEILEVVAWNQLNIHNKPVILLNVLSYYNPLRELIRNGVREGFIQPLNEKLCVFVDGPADQKDHESFDWGKATVDAIAAWQHVQAEAYPIHWTKDIDTSPVPISKPSIKETNGMNGALYGLSAINAWLAWGWLALRQQI